MSGLAFDVRTTFTARGADPFEVNAALEVADGETLVVLGPSGSGKTLLLECLGGFHDHEGSVRLDGRDVTGEPPERRGFGFVFQEYALFPHATVRENVSFGARYHDEVRDPDELLAALGVADLVERTPRTLSGGEKQRVALARALAIQPAVLLLDEPLSALDAPTRQELREDLADVLEERTAVYVTHDRTTARALADRVAVVRDGRVVQIDAPQTVFERPSSAFVARFVGANVLPADAHPTLRAAAPEAERAAVRPEHVLLGDGAPATGSITRIVREDATHRVIVRLDGGTELSAYVDDPPDEGARIGVDFPADRVTSLRE